MTPWTAAFQDSLSFTNTWSLLKCMCIDGDAIQPSHPVLPFSSRLQSSQHQFSSVAQSSHILCNPMNLSTPGLPVHHRLPESIQTHVHCVVMPSNHLILCLPLLLAASIFPRIRVFSNEFSPHQVAKVLEFQLQHQSLQNTQE